MHEIGGIVTTEQRIRAEVEFASECARPAPVLEKLRPEIAAAFAEGVRTGAGIVARRLLWKPARKGK